MGTVIKNRGTSCVGVRKTGTTLIHVSTVMGTLYGTWESNNKLILKYEKEYEGGQWVVILQKTDDGYLFISNQKAD